MEGRHRSGAAKAKCVRGPARASEVRGGWGGSPTLPQGGRSLAHGSGEARAKLSFDPDTLPSVLCVSYFSFEVFAVFLNTTYISNSLNSQSDCESKLYTAKHPGFCRKNIFYLYSDYPKTTNSDILETLLPPIILFDYLIADMF